MAICSSACARPASVIAKVRLPSLVRRGDEALVGQHLERRVDGSRAGSPAAVGLGLERLDELVAVPGPVEQGDQEGRAHVAAAHAASARSLAVARLGSAAPAASVVWLWSLVVRS